MDLYTMSQAFRKESGDQIRQGTISDINADSTVDVTLAGGTTVIPSVKCLSSYCPIKGGSCWLVTNGSDAYVMGSMADPGPAHIRIRRGSTQGISTGTSPTVVDWTATPTTLDDAWGMLIPGTSTSRLYIPVPGIYQATFSWGFAANATGFRQGSIRQGGTTYAIDRRANNGASDSTYGTVSTTLECALDDYIEFTVAQNSGGDLNLLDASAYTASARLVWLGYGT